MSSYMNFYLVPKKKDWMTEEPKPLLFNSYSRGNEVYQSIYEELNPVWYGNGDTPAYTEITADDIQKVIKATKEHLKKVETRLKNGMEGYKKLSGQGIVEAVNDYVASKEYIEEIKQNIADLKGIYNWMFDLEYSDFEKKVLINYD